MTATVVLLGLAAGTYGLKAVAPLALGGRELPERLTRVANLLPAALLAALVLVSTFTSDGRPAIDARAAGLAAAGVATGAVNPGPPFSMRSIAPPIPDANHDPAVRGQVLAAEVGVA